MRPVDENGNATVNKKAVKKYVEDTLAWKVNTQYFDRRFKTANSGMITVYGGTYGYVLDKKKEAKKLIESGEKPTAAAKSAAEMTGYKKNEIYRELV